MSFTNKFGIIIHKFDEKINTLVLNNGLTFYNFSANFDLLCKKEIVNGDYSFADVWFDINKDDTLYGLINREKGKLIHLYINNNFIVHSNILKYDPNIYEIKFPYIKKIDTDTHIIYFLINNNTPSYCTLIHHSKKNGQWIKSQIDYVQYNILSNFVITFKNATLNIFYFKIINSFEELFLSTLDLTNNIWAAPLQITNSHKYKVYLSVIQDLKGYYHIAFSENNSNKYHCTYINGYIKENKFINSNYVVISKTVACTFPNIIEHDNIIYTQWIEYHDLYKSFSIDSGITWTNPIIDNKASEYPFLSYSYRSNYIGDKSYNFSNMFALENSIEILGVDN